MQSAEKKQALMIAAAIVLGALIIAWAVKPKSGIEPAPTPARLGAPTPAAQEQAAGSTQGAVAYTAMVKKYGALRMQFDSECAAAPVDMTVKNGTRIMLDNRDESARVVSIGDQRYTLPGYGWLVVTVSSDKPFEKLLVDCGRRQNVATILVQK